VKERTMKWLWSISVATMALSTFAAAQSGAAMGKSATADMSMTDTYVGCVEAGSAPGSFVLTHVSHDSMHKPSMKHDGDGMDDMNMAMTPSAVMLDGSSVSKRHLGHKVSVTGTVTMDPKAMGQQMSTLAVKSLKVVGKSCS
jgi:hypothetical protein